MGELTHSELVEQFKKGVRLIAVSPTNRYLKAVEYEVLHVDENKVVLRTAWGGKVEVGPNSEEFLFYTVSSRW